MTDNKLTDFERAEFYKSQYEKCMKSRGTAIIVFAILSFIIGFFVGADIIKI